MWSELYYHTCVIVNKCTSEYVGWPIPCACVLKNTSGDDSTLAAPSRCGTNPPPRWRQDSCKSSSKPKARAMSQGKTYTLIISPHIRPTGGHDFFSGVWPLCFVWDTVYDPLNSHPPTPPMGQIQLNRPMGPTSGGHDIISRIKAKRKQPRRRLGVL